MPAVKAGTEKEAAAALVLNFNDATKMAWPVSGNVILDYSMESTIYFPTLDQYKCNPGIVIQGAVSTPVIAPANAKIQEIGSNEELGNYVVLNMGNDYTAVCGQLKELQVVENEYVAQGDVLGYVAEPTKYYSIEGASWNTRINPSIRWTSCSENERTVLFHTGKKRRQGRRLI